MKNKFKKSKIIVPALALITATTAASVTGTVAWFTANRAVTVNAGDFVATKLESNLTVTTAAGLGTAASNGNTGITTMTGTNSDTTNKLTHGSYDAKAEASGSLYVAKVSDDGKEFESFNDLKKLTDATVTNPTTSNCSWMARNDSTNKVNIWYGVSWTMTFKLDGATTNTADYLFLDVKDSTFTDKSNKSNTTANGFRIAFMTANKFMVLGGDDIVTHVDTNTKAEYEYKKASSYNASATYYIEGVYTADTAVTSSTFDATKDYTYNSSTGLYSLATSFTEGTLYYTKAEGYTKTTAVTSTNFTDSTYYTKEWVNSYASYTKGSNYFVAGSDVTKASDASTTEKAKELASNVYNLGAVDSTNGLAVTCVAWYEGSDTSVADENASGTIDMSTINAELDFYTRGVLAA